MAPTAFISHAGEDKDRFVRSFAAGLMQRGVKVWFDEWEMGPGDSLVDLIFQGISTADFVIVVISTHSISKPWVREELNAGFMKRIRGKCKLIPVLLDDCEVPECLQSTLWEQVTNCSDIEGNVTKIANVIHGIRDTPPLGPAPKHTNATLAAFSELSRQDQHVLSLICESTLERHGPHVFLPLLMPKFEELGLSFDEVRDSIELLGSSYYLKDVRMRIDFLGNCEVPLETFEQYLTSTQSGYSSMVDRICLAILNDGMDSNRQIQAATQFPERIVAHVMLRLNSLGLIDAKEYSGATINVNHVSPKLRRQYCS